MAAGRAVQSTTVGRIEVQLERYDAPVAQALVAAAMAELGARYGGGSGDETPVSPAELTPPAGAFLVAYLDGVPVGCAGWRSHGDDGTVAELKRMYTTPEARGRGVARRLLAEVEWSARGYGRTRMILECGNRQPEAITLYTRSGYQRIDDFGYYRDEPDVLSFGRDL